MARHDDEDALGRTVTATRPADGPLEPPSPDALERRAALGRYVVLDRLGSGGMGVVYSAYDPELGRKLAIKVLPADAQVNQARLRREAQAMARLQHPNVVAVYDVGLFQQRVFIAMELVEGETLEAWGTSATRSWRQIVDIFVQAGRGLAAAHAVGLVHRDFKPGNVLVGSDGRPRVGDFGLARATHDAEAQAGDLPDLASLPLSSSTSLDETLTHTGTLLGTPSYMSPEQLQARSADARSDQFSFCVALYRALFGQRPFAGETLHEIAASVRAGKVTPPPRDSRVPAWVQKVVLRGLAIDPASRWPSMDVLLPALAHNPAERRRRSLAAAGAVAALVALVVAGWATLQRRHRALCGGAAAQLASVWDDGRRRAIRASFHATGAPFAEEAFDRVSRALDAFASGWVRTRTDACEATRIRGDQSEELLDLRMQCLAERRAGAQALVDLFAHADARIVERAAKMSAGVADLSECSDVPRLRSPVRLPAQAEARAAVQALRLRLARATALDEAGKFDEALPLAEAAVADATRLGHAPTRAAALQLLGVVKWQKGRMHDAESTFVTAAATAVGGRDDTTAARAWTSLVRLVGGDLQRFDEADHWAMFAEATIERLGSDELRASFLQARGVVELMRGRYEPALADAQRVLELREKLFGAESVPVADALTVVGNALNRLNRNDEALAAHERALALRTKLQGAEHPDVALSLDSLASVLQILGRYDEELADFRRALAIRERTAGHDSPQVAVLLDNIGLALAMQDHLTESAESHRRAVEIYDKLGVETMDRAVATFNLGDRLMHLHRDAEAAVYLGRALATEEKLLGPRHPELGWTLSAMGELRLRQHDAAGAVKLLERAVDIWKDGHIQPMNLGQTRFVLARALWEHGDQKPAREVAKQARADLAADTPVPESKKELAELDAWMAARR